MGWKYVCAFILLGYVALSILTDFNAPSIMYAPPLRHHQHTSELIHLRAADGVEIVAKYYPNKKAHYTILYCHGNAEDLQSIQPLMKLMQQQGYAVMAFDYHGYGLSQGVSSERATYLDAEAAYDYMVKQLQINPSQIIVLGKSLGAAVALQLALNHKVAGLVMESPFLSAYRTYTQLPILLFDKYRNDKKINQLSVPLLVIHGKKDEVIPFWQGKALYERASVPKLNLWIKNAGHNNVLSTAQQQYWQILHNFSNLIADDSNF